MPSARIAVNAELSDVLLPDLPFVKREEYDECIAFSYDQADGAGYVAIPGSTAITTIQLVVLQPTQAVTVRINAQTDQGTPVAAGGLFLCMGTSITAITVDNSSGATVDIRGALFGT
jgi:hypothetical protein